MFKKILAFLIISVVIFQNSVYNAKAYSAVSYCLYDPVLKKVIASADMNRHLSMASTTKIMTALIACEICDFSKELVVTEKMIAVEGSSIGLQVGDKISYECLLYGLMLESGNDAALCIAIGISGSQESFAALMNEKARQIGMKNTNFVTANGLDNENHYSTAYDMAILGGVCMNNEALAKIVGTKQYKAVYNNGETYRTYFNHNRLLSSLEGAEGIKTGFTKKSGRCLVTSCKRNGVRLIAVTLNDGNDWKDHRDLYDYGFKQYQQVTLPKVNKYVGITGGKKNEIKAESTDKQIYFYDGLYSYIKQKIYIPKFLYAPIKKGDKIGYIEYVYNDAVIATADIKALESTKAISNKIKKPGFFERFFKLLFLIFSIK